MSNNISYGIGLGNVIAIAISIIKYRHVGWAILHAILGWFYVIYHLIINGWAI